MARPRNTGGRVYPRRNSAILWVCYRDAQSEIRKESTGTTDPQEAERFLRKRLDARDDGALPALLSGKKITFNEWLDWFLEMRSKPPFRTEKTHDQNLRIAKLVRPVFGSTRLSDVSPEAIENYLRRRLQSGRKVPMKLGAIYRGKIKPATVHQEFRVLKRIFNVAVKQRRLGSNPCNSVEFPVNVRDADPKPHYVTATEQERIEFFAPLHLKNVIVIMTEMGLRPYKELMPMTKSQVDLENSLVHIADSKSPSGVGDMPMTDAAREAFRSQIEITPGAEYLFPSPRKNTHRPYIKSLKTSWTSTLKRAGVPYFPIYHLRHTFASRLSAGGVADHFVTLMLRQGDSQVFKRYSQAKLNMMREALERLDRHANERGRNSGTPRPN
jgi:integrase